MRAMRAGSSTARKRVERELRAEGAVSASRRSASINSRGTGLGRKRRVLRRLARIV
nr:MAG TPA: hypothetical protein [Caudoviricetes sp.]